MSGLRFLRQGGVIWGAGQQPPLPGSDMDGGGQLTDTAVPACTGTADVAVLTWPAVRDAGLP
jgi:hypothetical protein